MNYSGKYITNILQPDGKTWSNGPEISINTSEEELVMDGCYLLNATFTEYSVSWMASSEISCSGSITFDSSYEGLFFSGKYIEGNGSLPSENNFYGISSIALNNLSKWNGTYNTFIKNGSEWIADNKLIINAPQVIYKDKELVVYSYRSIVGDTNIDEFSWFIGSEGNIIIRFSKEYSGCLTFYGAYWLNGLQPKENNFIGTTKETSEPPTITSITSMIVNVVTATFLSDNITILEISNADSTGENNIKDASIEKPEAKADTKFENNTAEEDSIAASDLRKKASEK